MSVQEVRVPDLGDFKDVPVIEVLVKAGDTIAVDAPMIILESDKASMEVPSPAAGVVREVKVKLGDKISKGSLVLLLEVAGESGAAAPAAAPAPAPATAASPAGSAARPATAPEAVKPGPAAPHAEVDQPPSVQEVRVPDLGDFKDIPIIEVHVKAGDTVAADAPLITLESDKASMEVPSPVAGVIREVKVKLGDKISKGSLVLLIEVTAGASASAPPSAAPAARAPAAAGAATAAPATAHAPAPPATPAPAATESAGGPAPDSQAFKLAHAGPGVRALAREMGVDLARLTGSGPKGRILRDDLSSWVKAQIAAPSAAAIGSGLELAPWPKVDFAKYGPIETRPLARIRKIAGKSLHRNWVMIPHVTNHDDADITELEAFRVKINAETEKSTPKGEKPVKVTMLAFLIKAVVATLQEFPDFNSSLDGETQVLKGYWHIGFAADTPAGLLVPVIKDADKKGVLAIARETSDLAAKAREGKLQPADMQGATFSISSLGGIGGTYFTPIINAPEVAILGVCRSATRAVWDEKGGAFVPRLILPLSLSWDHRVVDGAGAARFNSHLGALLADARRLVL